MKKAVFIALVLVGLSAFDAWAQGSQLVVVRNKIFDECREMRPLLEKSRDIIVINSMWSSGVLAVSQLDAYFYMVGIFNAADPKQAGPDSVDYLSKWLSQIKANSELNIKSLNNISYQVEPATKAHIEKLKNYFKSLNGSVATELTRVLALKVSVKRKKDNG